MQAVTALKRRQQLARKMRIFLIEHDARDVCNNIRDVEQAEDDQIRHGRTEQEDESPRIVQRQQHFTLQDEQECFHRASPPFPPRNLTRSAKMVAASI